jgi:hypothetical protein
VSEAGFAARHELNCQAEVAYQKAKEAMRKAGVLETVQMHVLADAVMEAELSLLRELLVQSRDWLGMRGHDRAHH